MIFKKITFVLILELVFFLSVSVFSQRQDFRFNHLTTDDGLSQSNVTCILQDNKGFMWFGTFNGLNKFDGYDFTTFNYSFEDTNSISHNYISSLYQDQDGYLWVGTSEGLNRYDYETNIFKSYKHQEDNPNSISDNQIGRILKDSKGRLWIGTRNGGLVLFDPETDGFVHPVIDNKKISLENCQIDEVFEDSDGNLWIAHSNGTLDIYEMDESGKDIFKVYRIKLTNFQITTIVESANKNIWIATQGDGLYRVKLVNGNLKRLAYYANKKNNTNKINSNIILSLMVDNDSTIWIGTEDNGINILNIETNEIKYIKQNPFDQFSLNHNSIWKMYKDRSNNIWIGTYAYGLNLLVAEKSFIQHYKNQTGNINSLSHNMVNSFVEDKNGNIWIATDGGGLNFFNKNRNRFKQYNSKNSNIDTDVIVSLLEDKQNRLWLGTWTNGLYQFNKSTKMFTRYTQNRHGFGSNRILHMCEDRNGGLWLATFFGGLTYFNVNDQSIIVYNSENSGLSDNYVRAVNQDFDGNLWIGTDSGLDFFNTKSKQFVNYKHDEKNVYSLSKGFVHAIIQTEDSTLWIGTTGGLSRLDQETNKFIHYGKEHGLTNNEIKCIILDENEIIWLSTNKGIFQFNSKSETFKNFDVTDGLQGNEFNIRSGLVTTKGEILFGGNNGFNIFRPENLKDNTYIPPVVITELKIFNQTVPIGGPDSILQRHISKTEKITLSYNDAVFSFDFVALNYVSPEKNQYAYFMEGFEDDWNYVGSKRSATYTNLDPGEYKFKVKASNSDGIWNEEGTSIKITIEPPIWKTWWAYLIEMLLLIAAIAFIANYFISRQRLRNALRLEHIELEKMYELDQMKTQFFSNISHEFHSPMTLILSPLEKIISSLKTENKIKNSLKLIHRSAQRLLRMTNQLRDFQKIESGELQLRLSRGDIIFFLRETIHSFQDYAIDHCISYQFNSEQERFITWFDADKIDKIVYNLLSNAFKFTPDNGEIKVDVSVISSNNPEKSAENNDLPHKYIKIVISDNGIGIPKDKIEHIFQRYYRGGENNGIKYPGSGVGLAFVNELVNLYQGEISVESTEEKGAKFTVQIPIDENYLEEKQLVGEFKSTNVKHMTDWDFPMSFKKEDLRVGSSPRDTSEVEMPVLLIVEDDKEIRDYIIESLESNYRIFSANNGQKGIKKATKIIPDLIVTDIKMPELSGIELCNQLKEDEKTSHIPIILLTAYTSKKYKLEGLKKGADAYLSKPFNIDELEAQIINLLESRKKLIEKYSGQILLDPIKGTVKDIDEKFLQRVIKAIEEHISDSKFNAEGLSKKIGMSRMQLYRKLRGLTNLTVHELMRSIRLKRAIQLLEDKRMTITEVAYEVGFNDLTYFARCFRKQYKKSPSEFISDKN